MEIMNIINMTDEQVQALKDVFDKGFAKGIKIISARSLKFAIYSKKEDSTWTPYDEFLLTVDLAGHAYLYHDEHKSVRMRIDSKHNIGEDWFQAIINNAKDNLLKDVDKLFKVVKDSGNEFY